MIDEWRLMNFVGKTKSVIYAPIDYWNNSASAQSLRLKRSLNVFFAHPESKIQRGLFPWQERRQPLNIGGFPASFITPQLLFLCWLSEDIFKGWRINSGTDGNGPSYGMADVFDNYKRIEKGAPVVIEKKTWTGTMRVWWLLKGNSDSNPRSLAVDQGFPSSIGG